MPLSRLKTMKKTTRSNLITFAIVIVFYLVVQILSGAGLTTRSFEGQLVPICAYVVLAISLNLTVGFLGELSLGHAGFMSVGAFSGTIIWTVLYGQVPNWLGLVLSFVVGGAVRDLLLGRDAHDVDISYSTRESAAFRDHMATLGVTTMSAESKTEPGGYFTYPQALEQFHVSDERTAAEVEAALRRVGREPVWKDWDASFDLKSYA